MVVVVVVDVYGEDDEQNDQQSVVNQHRQDVAEQIHEVPDDCYVAFWIVG